MNNIDLFTRDEVRAARRILNEVSTWEVRHKIFNNVVTEETMKRIDKETGQSNDRQYMAYRLEHIAISNDPEQEQ